MDGQGVVLLDNPPVLVELLHDCSSTRGVRRRHAAARRRAEIFVVGVPEPIRSGGLNVCPGCEHEDAVRPRFGGSVSGGTPPFRIERFGAGADGHHVPSVGGLEDPLAAVSRGDDGQGPRHGSSVGIEPTRPLGVGRGVVAPRI